MKKILITLAIFIAMIACNSGGDKKEGDNKSGENKETTKSGDNKENGATDVTGSPDYQKGLDLVAKDDCTTCHKVDGELSGPGYKQVAQKYQGASEEKLAELAQAIIKGSKGIWGETAMPPHSSLSEEDAKAMVRYILLLK